MIDNIDVIRGRGRVGSAMGRSAPRARACSQRAMVTPGLIMLCVPDSAIREVARSVPAGPWIAHVSGATPLAALNPHTRRFGVHPLQTFTRSKGAEQLDGAWAAVTAESDDGRARGRWLATQLGLAPFDMAEDRRVLYHAGAAMASNYLVTLFRAASRAVETAGAPPEALLPLMRRTIDNNFELTGPISRGDSDHGRGASGRHSCRAARARGALPRARRGDRPGGGPHHPW